MFEPFEKRISFLTIFARPYRISGASSSGKLVGPLM